MKRISLSGWLMALAATLVIGMVAPAVAENIVVNGSFESPVWTTLNGLPNNYPGTAKWNAFQSSAVGWDVYWQYTYPVTMDFPIGEPLLEIQANGVYSASSIANDGTQWAELDSDWTGPFSAGANPPIVTVQPVHQRVIPVRKGVSKYVRLFLLFRVTTNSNLLLVPDPVTTTVLAQQSKTGF